MARKDAVKGLLAIALLALLAAGLYRILSSRAAPSASAAKAPSDAELPLESLSMLPATVAATARASASGADVSGVEICGIGKVQPAADDIGANQYVVELTRPALQRWLGALRNSDDYRARAMGLLVASFPSNAPGQAAAAQTARDELVAMAAGSTDPVIYGIALKSCDRPTESGSSCGQLSPDAWARLDPDNAAPWLLMAARARANQDKAAEAAAFAKAAAAHRSEGYIDSILGITEPDMPTDTTPLELWSLAIHMIGIQAASVEAGGPTYAYCSKDALRDKTVTEQCGAIAELWVARPTNLIQYLLGRGLGARVGWPQQRLADLKQRAAAYEQVLSDDMPLDPALQWRCDTVAKGNAYIEKATRLGEVGAAEYLLAHSAESIPELARRHEEAMKRMMEQAQQQAHGSQLP